MLFLGDRFNERGSSQQRKKSLWGVPIQLTIVTQALNTRTHTNHTVVTIGSTKIVITKVEELPSVCCFWLPRGLWDFVGGRGGGGGNLAFQGLFTDRQLLDPCSKGHIQHTWPQKYHEFTVRDGIIFSSLSSVHHYQTLNPKPYHFLHEDW